MEQEQVELKDLLESERVGRTALQAELEGYKEQYGDVAAERDSLREKLER